MKRWPITVAVIAVVCVFAGIVAPRIIGNKKESITPTSMWHTSYNPYKEDSLIPFTEKSVIPLIIKDSSQIVESIQQISEQDSKNIKIRISQTGFKESLPTFKSEQDSGNIETRVFRVRFKKSLPGFRIVLSAIDNPALLPKTWLNVPVQNPEGNQETDMILTFEEPDKNNSSLAIGSSLAIEMFGRVYKSASNSNPLKSLQNDMVSRGYFMIEFK